MTSRPFGHSTYQQSRFVALPRVDLVTLLECVTEELPVLFSRFDELENYCLDKKLRLEKVPGICCSEAVIATGDFEGRRNHFVDFVWVRASSKRYREVVKKRFQLRDPHSSMPADLHIDHIVNRGSLKQLQQSGVDPWVMLFEVPWSANVGFGCNVERGSDQVSSATKTIGLTGLHLYKLYATDYPKSKEELQLSLDNIRGQILSKVWIERIEKSIQPYMKKFG